VDNIGNTALHWATQYNNSEICNLLVSSQADPGARNYNDQTPLDNATEHEMLKAYIGEIIRQNENLVVAARKGDID